MKGCLDRIEKEVKELLQLTLKLPVTQEVAGSSLERALYTIIYKKTKDRLFVLSTSRLYFFFSCFHTQTLN